MLVNTTHKCSEGLIAEVRYNTKGELESVVLDCEDIDDALLITPGDLSALLKILQGLEMDIHTAIYSAGEDGFNGF